MDINEIKEMLENITPGNWPDWSDPEIRKQCWMHYDILNDREHRIPVALMPSDAKFIAQAPQIISDLIDRIEYLERQAEEDAKETEHLMNELKRYIGLEADLEKQRIVNHMLVRKVEELEKRLKDEGN